MNPKSNRNALIVYAILICIALAQVLFTGGCATPAPGIALHSVQSAFPNAKVYASTEESWAYTVVDGDHVYYVQCYAHNPEVLETFVQTK